MFERRRNVQQHVRHRYLQFLADLFLQFAALQHGRHGVEARRAKNMHLPGGKPRGFLHHKFLGLIRPHKKRVEMQGWFLPRPGLADPRNFAASIS